MGYESNDPPLHVDFEQIMALKNDNERLRAELADLIGNTYSHPDEPISLLHKLRVKNNELGYEVEKQKEIADFCSEKAREFLSRAEKAELALVKIAYGHGNAGHSADNYRAIALEALAQKEPSDG